MASTIDRVYKSADYMGSLVVPEGPRHRPTDWIKDKPASNWGPFEGIRRFIFGDS